MSNEDAEFAPRLAKMTTGWLKACEAEWAVKEARRKLGAAQARWVAAIRSEIAKREVNS